MDSMNHHHDESPPSTMTQSPPHHMSMTPMHMTFFWGKDTQILFSYWPGKSSGMYALALFFVFFLCFLIELLSRAMSSGSGNRVASGLGRTLVHCLRVGISYLVMLAIMSFNGGVFLAAVLGHALGFLVFGSRVFGGDGKTSDVANSSTC